MQISIVFRRVGVALGFVALMAMMSLPVVAKSKKPVVIALGTFGGAMAAMPRSGQWMVRVKKAFGVVMIVVAEYLLLQAGQRFI